MWKRRHLSASATRRRESGIHSRWRRAARRAPAARRTCPKGRQPWQSDLHIEEARTGGHWRGKTHRSSITRFVVVRLLFRANNQDRLSRLSSTRVSSHSSASSRSRGIGIYQRSIAQVDVADPGPPRPQPAVPSRKLERMASSQAAKSFI